MSMADAPHRTWEPPRGPDLCADVIVARRLQDGRLAVLLIERRFPPPGWAIPGGFVEKGERVEEAARRELEEETGLVATRLWQWHLYSDPRRDPRRHTATLVFVGEAEGEPVAGDDAGLARFWPLDALPPLAFDHAQVLADFAAGRFVPADPLAAESLGTHAVADR